MSLPIPVLLQGEMFFDYTVNQLWIGTLTFGNQQIPLETLNGITFPDSTVQTTAAIGGDVFPVLAPDGSAGAPSYSFANDPTTGIYRQATGNRIAFTFAGADEMAISANGAKLKNTGYMGWVPSTDLTVTPDTTFVRTGPAAVALGVSGNSTGSLSLALLQIGANTGLSRTAAGTVAIGNGTAGDFSGELDVTQISKVTDLWTAGVTETPGNAALLLSATTSQVGVPSGGSVILAQGNSPMFTAASGIVTIAGNTSVLAFAANTGISRVSAGTLALGNGTTGDFTGQLRLNQLADVLDIWGPGVTQSGANSSLHIPSATVTQVGVPTGGSVILAVNNAAVVTVASGSVAMTGATVVLGFGNSTGISRLTGGSLALGNGTTGDVTGELTLGQIALTAVAPTVAAAQVGLGSTTATTIGANGAASALTANPVGYLIINVAGTKMKIPYYNN